MHGGEIAAHSDGVGQGAEFVVTLPAARSVAPPLPEPERPPRPTGVRVLLVDDNTDAADLLAEVLRARGHRVEVAYDGVQALQVVRAFRPEVAVLDIGLPVMDGYELARQLRQAGLDRCRLVALTGYGQEQDRERSRAAGFAAHLVKPVDPEALEVALDRG
jgi:CheY-like chemotaxis protein